MKRSTKCQTQSRVGRTGRDVQRRAKCLLRVGSAFPDHPSLSFPSTPHPCPSGPSSAWRASVRWTTRSYNPDLWSCSGSAIPLPFRPYLLGHASDQHCSTRAGIHRPLKGLSTVASLLLTGATDTGSGSGPAPRPSLGWLLLSPDQCSISPQMMLGGCHQGGQKVSHAFHTIVRSQLYLGKNVRPTS